MEKIVPWYGLRIRPIVMHPPQLADEIGESAPASKQPEFSGKGKEPIAWRISVSVNNHGGQQRTPLRVLMPRDLIEQDVHPSAMPRLCHIQAHQRRGFAVAYHPAVPRDLAESSI